jgi:hypothetical protein
MATFDTTKIQQNQPGLTYATPQAMPAKYNSFAGILDVADTAIKGAVQFDKQQTLGEAQELGQKLADDYESMSPTNLNQIAQDQQSLQQQLADDPDNEAVMNELNQITTLYNKAKEQNVMSPYEYERRVLKDTQALANRNPAYADEIAKGVNQALGNRGIANLMKQDNLLYERQIAAETDRLKIIDDYLRTKNETPMFMDNDDKEELYIKYRNEDKDRATVKQMIEDGSLRNQEIAAALQEDINLKGGTIVVASNEMLNITNELNNIEDRLLSGELDGKAADREKNIIILEARKYLGVIAALPPTDENKQAYELMKEHLNSLSSQSSDALSGKTFKERLENTNATIAAQQNFGRLLAGKDRESLELMNLEIKAFEFISSSAGISFAPGEKQARQQSIINLAIIQGKKFAIDNPSFAQYTKNGEMIQKGITELQPVFEGMIKGNKVSPEMLGYYNNIFNTAEYHANNSKNRYEYDSNFLKTVNNMSDSTFKHMLGNSDTFLEDAKNEAAVFLGGIRDDLLTNSVLPEQIEMTDEGVFYSNASVASKRVARNLNTAAKLDAKINEVNATKETAIKLLGKLTGNETKKEYTDGEFTVRIKQ